MCCRLRIQLGTFPNAPSRFQACHCKRSASALHLRTLRYDIRERFSQRICISTERHTHR
jgi:hypothetical protein